MDDKIVKLLQNSVRQRDEMIDSLLEANKTVYSGRLVITGIIIILSILFILA